MTPTKHWQPQHPTHLDQSCLTTGPVQLLYRDSDITHPLINHDKTGRGGCHQLAGIIQSLASNRNKRPKMTPAEQWQLLHQHLTRLDESWTSAADVPWLAMQLLQQLVDVVFQKLDLVVFLHQQLSKLVSVTHQQTAAARPLTPSLLHRTLVLINSQSAHSINPLTPTVARINYKAWCARPG